MKIKNYVLPATLSLFSISFVQAQTVDEIISKHIDAIGGKDKVSQVKSLYTENSVEVMGNTAPVKEYMLQGKGFKNEVEFNGSNIVSCFNDKGGWSINPMAGGTDATAMPDPIYKAGKVQIYFGGPLVDYAAKGYKAELSGKEGDSYKIKITGDGTESYYFIDAKTYYITKNIIKSEVMGQSVDVTTTYGDYKKTDFGVVIAYKKDIDMGMFQMSQKVDKVEVNKEIDAKIFDIPK